MGNGFTFELETLIFYAIVKAAQQLEEPGYYSLVYGDDIICYDRHYASVVSALELFGFVINEDKSFYGEDQPIRESCGKHYYMGLDITPFFVRVFPFDVHSVIKLLNDIRRFGCVDLHGSVIADPRLSDVWKAIYRKVKDLKEFRTNNTLLGDSALWCHIKWRPVGG